MSFEIVHRDWNLKQIYTQKWVCRCELRGWTPPNRGNSQTADRPISQKVSLQPPQSVIIQLVKVIA